MNDRTKLHDEVSEFYARAVVRSGSGSASVEGAVLTDYAAADLAGLPDDVLASAFGCGNPVAFSRVKPGDTVVDLGSGAGIDLLIAGRKVGAQGRVIGVDMTDAMIERARANIAAAGLANVELRKGLIEELPVDDASVDWVISNCVINLSPDKPAVFAEIARVLKPGGEMLVSDIVVEDLPDWVRENKALYSACVAGAISEGDYVAGLRAAGLADVEVRDRLVYDAGQLEAMYREEMPDVATLREAGETTEATLRRAAVEAAGKVWSINVYARKPAA